MRKTLIALAASLLAATAAHAATNLVANGTFDNPDLATGSFEQVSVLNFNDLQWGHYSGGTGVTKLVDVGGEQFAQIATGDIMYAGFTAATSGTYNISFDYNGSGLWGLSSASWAQSVIGYSFVTPQAGWTTQTATASLVAGESYKIYFGGMVTPPAFYPTLNIDNVSVAAAVPEPETYAMMLAGLGAIGLMSRRRMHKQG
ncbi:PEP-CTERM sorting domain-containing protein [Sphaerotilus uruguayifluvii]|uniref:Ice-binding protein C-terminal domain-containing protein n=1 Tax=Sphaerotilus uruguayifluvii TaxID=2735897 RepID=A0ABX2G5J8_9BURK|nr:PEP-CTERM sorting domain-containing protein [Leptothrix sp. C29]NRT56679.1 hypothetical protein [Leptothrix sp. C29]